MFIGFAFCSFHGNSQTQAEMNEEANKNYKKADKELNTVYNAVLREYKTDTAFIKNFKKAQRLWVQFRDAQMDAKYPHPNEYGSIFPTCYYTELQELTNERTKQIRIWLTGIEEGDLCSGSVKLKID
jgi:uncharacterized protein YecT (DUF1311 family)